MSARAQPRLEIVDSQGAVRLDLARIAAAASEALPLCLARALPEHNVLAALEEVEITIVSDGDIARVHGQFLDDPSPTDVITFDHGEILVSADTAAARSPEFGNATDRELALYIIHGLLHLAGFGDKSPAEFATMRDAQEEVLRQVW